MVTKEELRGYREGKRELANLRHRSASEERIQPGGVLANAEIICESASMYRAAADALQEKLLRIESSIEAVADPRARQALRMRYIDGKSDIEIARRLNYSDRQVRRLIEKAVLDMEKE